LKSKGENKVGICMHGMVHCARNDDYYTQVGWDCKTMHLWIVRLVNVSYSMRLKWRTLNCRIKCQRKCT
jgi:hypothetical protein